MAIDVYQACCQNVRELKRQRKRILSLLNRAIRENDTNDIITLTKVYALLYSAFAEVSFVKLLNTPDAFSESEISQISNQRNLEEKWEKCFQLVFQRIVTENNKGSVANKKQTLNRLLKEYIIAPSQIRNKVAHGQWAVCLNGDCTSINNDSTSVVSNLDFVRIDILFLVYEKFYQCIIDLSISPRTHYRDYYVLITDLEEFVQETESWTLESKRNKILASSKFKNQQARIAAMTKDK